MIEETWASGEWSKQAEYMIWKQEGGEPQIAEGYHGERVVREQNIGSIMIHG